MSQPGFADLRVVEVAGSVAGAWTAKLFADLGAQVVKAEPPGGDPLRRCGEPWRADAGTLTAWLDTSKSSAVVDVDGRDGRTALQGLLATADVVVESSAPDPLRPVTADLGHDGLVTVLLSPFGTSGPHAGWRSTSLTDEAASGHVFLTGDPAREPLRGPGLQSAYAAGAFAFVGAMAALWARRRDGRGQTVEVSHLDAMVALHQFTFVRWTHGGTVLGRHGNRLAGGGTVMGGYACVDGWVSLSTPGEEQVERLLAGTGLTGLLARPGIGSTADLLDRWEELGDAPLRAWMVERTVEEVVAVLQELRVPVAPTSTMLGVLRDPHFAARGLWREVGGLRHPGPPFVLDHHPWRSTPAPHIGAAGGGTAPVARAPRDAAVADGGSDAGDGPLAGVRVLDLSRVWAGPLAARILADLGADVIMLEAPWARGPKQLPPSRVRAAGYYRGPAEGGRLWNRNGFINKYAVNKRSVALDIADEAGREVLERLVVGADVLLENYSARVMPQLGLDGGRLHELNPSLVYVTMPGYGRSGPCRDWVAYGNVIDGHGGMTSLTGYPGEHPWKSGVAWPDANAGVHAAAAVLVALWDREHDPERRGDTVEVAQVETLVATLGHELLAAQVRGADRLPHGNRHPTYAPQGVYPCQGDDRWIALSVVDDAGWKGLCQLAGPPDDLARLDLPGRRAAHDDLDAALAAFTRRHDAEALASHLQEVGVAAAPVLDAPGVMADPHVQARDLFVTLDHADTGPMPFTRLPVLLSRTPATYRRPAARLGEDNDDVLRHLAGLDDPALAHLRTRGVIADEPPL